MAVSQPKERLIALEASQGVKSADFEPHPSATGVNITAQFDGAGSLSVFRISTKQEVALLSTVATNPNSLAVVQYAYNTGPIRVVFSPGTAGLTGVVSASYFGYAGSGSTSEPPEIVYEAFIPLGSDALITSDSFTFLVRE